MSSKMDQEEARFVSQAKEALDRNLEDLDRQTVSRLQRLRLSALEQVPTKRLWLVWASGFAMASVAVLAMILWVGRPASQYQNHLPALEDLELITSSENVELSEDLDFYGWLAETQTTG